MARLNVAPTRSNMLNMKRDLGMAREGFTLLDQKREILVMELMRMLDRVRRVQENLEKARTEAYEILKKAIAYNGYYKMSTIGETIHYEHVVENGWNITAGVRTPKVSVKHSEFKSQFGFAGTDSLIDNTMQNFLKLMKIIGELAELETAIWLLARDLKKTQRRVNALEQIFIPDFNDTLRYITESLESKELESFSVLKMIKDRLKKQHEAEE